VHTPKTQTGTSCGGYNMRSGSCNSSHSNLYWPKGVSQVPKRSSVTSMTSCCWLKSASAPRQYPACAPWMWSLHAGF